MKRGEIWTVAGGKDDAGKPRPAVVVQTDAPHFRLSVQPNERNGLRAASRLTAAKITTVPKTKAGERIGRPDDEDILGLNHAVLVFLGLAVPPRAKAEEA